MANTNPARGMRDFLPSDVRKREYVIDIIKEVYQKYGFEPLETPSVENLETLTGKYGEEGNQLIFKILKRGEKLDLSEGEKGLSDLALRYDLTVPLARVVANYKDKLPKFFKRYQIQPVWRADRPARGRFREFYQCDVDAIGSSSMVVEAELILAVTEILERLGFKDFIIRINHREILFSLLRTFGVPEEKHIEALTAIDKIDKIGSSGVEKELNSRGIPNDANKQLINAMEFFIKDSPNQSLSGDEKLKTLELVRINATTEIEVDSNTKEFLESLSGQDLVDDDHITILEENIKLSKNTLITAEIFKRLKTLLKDDLGLAARSKLWQLWGFLAPFHGGSRNELKSTAASRFRLDPSLARGLSYYTGAIFEIGLTNGDFAGSIGGGGRYDGLIGMFGKEQIPACGFSLGLERILVVMEERGMFPPELQTNSADVMVTIWNEESIAESLKLANELRSNGLRVLVYPEADKLGKQFKYAGQINIPFVCILGENELAENKVSVKNMTTGEQEVVDRKEVVKNIK